MNACGSFGHIGIYWKGCLKYKIQNLHDVSTKLRLKSLFMLLANKITYRMVAKVPWRTGVGPVRWPAEQAGLTKQGIFRSCLYIESLDQWKSWAYPKSHFTFGPTLYPSLTRWKSFFFRVYRREESFKWDIKPRSSTLKKILGWMGKGLLYFLNEAGRGGFEHGYFTF